MKFNWWNPKQPIRRAFSRVDPARYRLKSVSSRLREYHQAAEKASEVLAEIAQAANIADTYARRLDAPLTSAAIASGFVGATRAKMAGLVAEMQKLAEDLEQIAPTDQTELLSLFADLTEGGQDHAGTGA